MVLMKVVFLWLYTCVRSSPTTSSIAFVPEFPGFSMSLCHRPGGMWLRPELLRGDGRLSRAILPVWKIRGSSDEVMSVLSSLEGRQNSFQLCFPFLGRKYVSALHSLSRYVYRLRARDS